MDTKTEEYKPVILGASILDKVLLSLSSLCLGLSVSLFIAANWDSFSVFQKFTMLEILLPLSLIGACFFKKAKIGFLVFAVFVIGGILALYAQIYSAGSDPWQLFALWAILIIPLVAIAKHQLLWGSLLLLSFTSYTLFLGSILERTDSIIHTLIYWAGFLLLSIVFYPFSKYKKFYGSKPSISFNIALMLSLVFGIGLSLFQDHVFMYVIILAGILYFLYHIKFQSVSVYIVALILLDISILYCIGRELFESSYSDGSVVFNLLLIFILSVGIFYGTIKILEAIVDHLTNSQVKYSHYLKLVFYAMGTIISTLLLIALVVATLFITFEVEHHLPFYVVGFILLALGVILTNKKKGQYASIFVFILTIAGLSIVIGTYLFNGDSKIYSTYLEYDLQGSFSIQEKAATFFFLAALFLAFYTRVKWQSYLYAGFAFLGFGLFFNGSFFYGMSFYQPYVSIIILVLVLLGLYFFCLFKASEAQKDRLNPILVSGMVGTLLVAIYNSGSTFLLPGMMRKSMISTFFPIHAVFQLNIRSFYHWIIVALALAVYYMLSRKLEILKTPKGYCILVIFIALNFLTPLLTLVFILCLLSIAIAHKQLMILNLVAMVWIFGTFYYGVGGLLIEKSIVLLVIGLAYFGVSVIGHRYDLLSRENRGKKIEKIGWLDILLMSVTTILCLGVINYSISGKEHLKQNGHRIFIALEPIDPRSLVQGDYMALRFELNEYFYTDFAYIDEDEDGVSHLVSHPKDGDGARIFRLVKANPFPFGDYPEWKIHANAWFFKEGDAEKWESARYGIFSVDEKGNSILVGMADRDKKMIE